jgi:hypothetical protein
MRSATVAEDSRGLGAQGFDFGARLIEHAAHALARFVDHIARDVGVVRRVLDPGTRLAVAQERRKGGGFDPGSVGGLDGGVQLRRQDEQVAPRLDDDPAYVAAGGSYDFDRLAFGRLADLVAHANEFVCLLEPGTALLTVLIEQSRHARRIDLGRCLRVVIGHG